MSSMRETREALGLSRKQVAELAGVTIGAVCSIEDGRTARDKHAATKITEALKIASAPPDKADLGKIYRLVQPAKEDWVVSTDWNGLKPGERFTVVDVEGSFSFIRHVTTKASTWVDGWGGRAGYGSLRSFHEGRVRLL